MSAILGKMEKPEAEQFRNGRTLFFVPLIITPPEKNDAITNLSAKYWEEVAKQLNNLESKLSQIKHIYHELLPADASIKQLEAMNIGSYSIVEKLMGNGAVVNEIENDELMREFIDWNLCLSLRLQSHKVFSVVYEAFQEVLRQRNEHIAKRIDETLKSEESAALFMREGHSVHFPSDVQIFYVAPPSLDALQRALREQQGNTQKPEHDDHRKQHETEQPAKDTNSTPVD
jgi:hypothetical protein